MCLLRLSVHKITPSLTHHVNSAGKATNDSNSLERESFPRLTNPFAAQQFAGATPRSTIHDTHGCFQDLSSQEFLSGKIGEMKLRHRKSNKMKTMLTP